MTVKNTKQVESTNQKSIGKVAASAVNLRGNKRSITYALGALLILLITTGIWSYLSARIHHNNADNLINPYLFDYKSVYYNALFPGQHTYLLKWPIFFLIHLTGNTDSSFVIATVIVSLMTVMGFAYILYSIEKRPVVLGTLFLLVASTLLLVPAQPYPGGLLPVGLGMIANRNLEYILFIGCMYAVIRHAPRSTRFYAAIVGLALLDMSDKLYLSLSIGGGLLACVVYAVCKQRHMAKLAAKWLLASLLAGFFSVAALQVGNALQLIHTSSQGAGPYAIVVSAHKLGLGVVYGILGVLTHFGANPSVSTTYLSQMPSIAFKHLFSLGGGALVLNLFIFIVAISASYRLFLFGLGHNKEDSVETDTHFAVAHLLLFVAATAFAAYIFTDHYYAADARYLTIVYFSFMIALTVYIRQKSWPIKRLKRYGYVLILMMVLALPSVGKQYKQLLKATATYDHRNELIAKALRSHRAAVLVGDYWRVVPIRQVSHNKQTVMPYANCTNPRGVLSSTSWQPDLRTTSFAYLLTIEKGLTDFPACGFDTVVRTYGKPNSSVVIAGTLDQPTEMLLFYDHGANHSDTPKVSQLVANSIAPIKLSDLPDTTCRTSTILTIVAHEDDDLLFINPDTLRSIKAGDCVRTIYVTSGDAGSNLFYWLGREQGSQAAYNSMMGVDNIWIQRTVKLADKQYLTVTSPKSNPNISLLYLRLPDGNLRGEGFKASKYKSLSKLYNGAINSIGSTYGNSEFSRNDLITALSEIMTVYKPNEIRTQSSYTEPRSSDHSDHMAVSRFSDRAYEMYKAKLSTPPASLVHYLGYTIHNRPENVFNQDLNDKSAAFFSYANHDNGVCRELTLCDTTTVYGNYIRRQYLEP